MSTPHQQLLAAIKLALRDAPVFSRVVFTRALTDATITAETDAGAVIATVKIAQRLVPQGKHGQLTVDDARDVKVEKPAAPAEPLAAPTPARTLAPSRLHLGFYADDLAKLSAGKLGELDDLISDGLVADTAALGRGLWWTVLPFSTADFLAVRRMFGEWCPVTQRAPDEQLDAMISAALELDADSMPSDVAKRFLEARNAQFAAQAAEIARETAADVDEPDEPTALSEVPAPVEGFVIEAAPALYGPINDPAGAARADAYITNRKSVHGPFFDEGSGAGVGPFIEEPASNPDPTHDAPLRYRVLILRDSGAWSLARRGLAAWDAIKTPGAGTQSGGSCSPLVMLYTPALGSPDVEKLLARLAKDGRRVLDLGEIARVVLFDHAPSNREIRKRWNAAHPDAVVPVGAEAGVVAPVVPTAAEPVAKPARKPRTPKPATVMT